MLQSSLAERSPATASLSLNARRPAVQVYGRSLALVLRASFEVIGMVCVVLVLALAFSPGLRAALTHAGGPRQEAAADDAADEAGADEGDGGESAGLRLDRHVVLDAAQSNVATYLARRYRVADDAVRVMVATAQQAGKERQIDPLLILAVVAVESSMNPFAQSPVGAIGLMQVMPGLHGAKFVEQKSDRKDDPGVLDPVANIRVGTEILGEVIRRGGSVERGLQLYVGAGNAPDDGGYAGRVLAEMGRLKLAASGGVAAALAAGVHADAHASPDGAVPGASSPATLSAEPPGQVSALQLRPHASRRDTA
jgi:soluble lytic murein transglycosylase-like protein